MVLVRSDPAIHPPRTWIWSVARVTASSRAVTWMLIVPTLTIWFSGDVAFGSGAGAAAVELASPGAEVGPAGTPLM
jgi:hypothetical protein